VNLRRLWRHLILPGWSLRRVFDSAALDEIEAAIAATERMHGGELRFAIETSLDAIELLRGVTPRERAIQAFARLGVWDTEANNGVLIYLLWADRDVEIVADRGYNGRVTSEEWSGVCRTMEALFGQGQARQAIAEGIRAAGTLMARHFPATDRNELPDQPIVM
jgi:uncharacterized membrane protein YgcG